MEEGKIIGGGRRIGEGELEGGRRVRGGKKIVDCAAFSRGLLYYIFL